MKKKFKINNEFIEKVNQEYKNAKCIQEYRDAFSLDLIGMEKKPKATTGDIRLPNSLPLTVLNASEVVRYDLASKEVRDLVSGIVAKPTKPQDVNNGSYCQKCNTFNEYVSDSEYTCYSCKL